jgi:DNA-binding transcriptional ArsR family regulator
MDDSPGTSPVMPPAPAVFQWRADTVFAMLGDERRRRLLERLASGLARPASKLVGTAGRGLDATLKHLTALRDSGLIIAQPDPQDGRRQLTRFRPISRCAPSKAARKLISAAACSGRAGGETKAGQTRAVIFLFRAPHVR